MAVLDRFQDPSYVNWVKAGQALLCTAEGIYDFCEGPIKQCHRKLHDKFPWKPCKPNCGVKKLCGVCTQRRREWRKDILKQLNPLATPCWNNVKVEMWETNYWELAKVFMGPGQDTTTGPSVTDPKGLLQLVINCKLFSNRVFGMESFKKVKQIRNKVFHSADFRLSDTELGDYINDMTTLLQDQTQLLTDDKAKKAIAVLQQIHKCRLEISDKQVLQHERAMWDTKFQEMRTMQSITQKQLQTVRDFINKHEDLKDLEKNMEKLKKQGKELEDRVTKEKKKHQEEREKLAEMKQKDDILEEENVQLARGVAKAEAVIYGLPNVEEELRKLKKLLREAQVRRFNKYLKNKAFFEKIELDKFNNIYVEPLIYKSGDYVRLETRSDINSLQPQMTIDQCQQVKVEELLSPNQDKEQLKVLITGSAGSGKSMLSLQLLKKWVDGQLPDFEDVFFYSMEELSRVEKSSLGDVLFRHQYVDVMTLYDEVVAEYIKRMSAKTLIVFDGLEAFGDYSSESETFDCHKVVAMSKLIGSIVCDHTLGQATLLVTSRPGGIDQYKKFDLVAEIYGFDETMIDEYVGKFYHGEDKLKLQISSYINSNTNISSLCHLPMFCSLVNRIGKVGLETMTRLVAKCVDTFVRERHADFRGKELDQCDVLSEIKDQLIHHSQLAKEGMSRQPVKVVFAIEDLKELSQKTATQCGFLNVLNERKQFYFDHLLMQEFFAAIALVSSVEEIDKLLDQTPNKGQLDMVLTFIAGLVGDPENRTFLESLGYNTTTKVANPKRAKRLDAFGYNIAITASDLLYVVIKHLQCATSEQGQTSRCNHKASILLLLRLVYESRDPYLWSEIRAFVLKGSTELDLSGIELDLSGTELDLSGIELDLSGTEITSADLQALVYVAQKTSDISSVDLCGCTITGDYGTAFGNLSQLTTIRQ